MKHSMSDKDIAPTGGWDECLIGCSLSSLLIHVSISHPSLVWKPAEAMRPLFLSPWLRPGTNLAMQSPPRILPRYSACSSKTTPCIRSSYSLILSWTESGILTWDQTSVLPASPWWDVRLMLGTHHFSLWSCRLDSNRSYLICSSPWPCNAAGSKSRFFYSLVTRR